LVIEILSQARTPETLNPWPKIVCFLTQSVQLTLLECVMWSSKMSWNCGKNEQICTVKFQDFLWAIPPDPHTVEGLRRPSPPPPASRLRASLRPLHHPSLCVGDILRYFRPWLNRRARTAVHRNAAIFESARAFDHILLRWEFHDSTSNGSRVIALTNKQTNKHTNRHYWKQYHLAALLLRWW